jgi:hypothetical protein
VTIERALKPFIARGINWNQSLNQEEEEVMFKRVIFIAVMFVVLMALSGTNALAGYSYYGWPGFAFSSPYRITHNVRGGSNLKTIEEGDATIDTTLRVLIGDLILLNPKDKIVLAGLGFSVPIGILADLEGEEPDENGNISIDQFLPFRPADCDFVPPGELDPLCPPGANLQQRFFDFWFPNLNFYDVVKNNSSILEVRIKLAQIEVIFSGDRARDSFVDTRYYTCEDLRADAWVGEDYIRGDVDLAADGTVIQSDPFACEDTYTTFGNKTIRISAPGPLGTDYDHDGDVLAVAEVNVNGNYFTPPFETTTGAGGTLTVYENGRFLYTPLRGWFGVESLSYIAVDSQDNLSNEAFWDIIVNEK